MKCKFLLLFILPMLIGAKLFAAPVITAINPSSGPVGTLVNVTGTDLNNPTAFTIGGTPAVIVSNNGTKLVAMVITATSGGAVSITTLSGSTSFGSFTTVNAVLPGSQWTKLKIGYMSVINADASTIVSNRGNVYTRSGENWTQQAQLALANRGIPVAISADGNTVATGRQVFIRDGSSWSKQGPDLLATNAEYDGQGASVALSADGNTMIEGNPNGDPSESHLGTGAAWVFVRSNGVWSQQTKLSINQILGLGYSVSLSADGNTAAVGAPAARNHYNDANGGDYTDGLGGVYIYRRTNGNWQQEGQLIYAKTDAQQGLSVVLSADGNTLVSGCYPNGAYVFHRINNIWVQESYLDDGGRRGRSRVVSISADGNTVLMGGVAVSNNDTYGGAWIFTRNNGTWTKYGDTYIPFDAAPNSDFGSSVSMSADGKIALIAANSDSLGMPATWLFKAGKREMTITYPLLNPVTYGAADVQTTAASSKPDLPLFYSSSDTTIATISATGKIHIKRAGTTNIIVTQPGNAIYSDADTVTRVFTVNKAPLKVLVDNKTLSEGFASFTGTVHYLGFVKGDTTANLTTLPTITTPATSGSTPGLYPITASGGAASNYDLTYTAAILTIVSKQIGSPKITSFSPASGYVGTLVTITGENIAHPSNLTIGGRPAIMVSSNSGKVVAMVTKGTVSGNISLTTDSGTVSAGSGFVVKTSLPFPVVQLGNKLSATGSSGNAALGSAVALSADGNTAIVGGPADNAGQGAAWIYARAGNSWAQQGGKLVGAGSTTTSALGKAVALSADGNTAVIGAYGDNANQGAAWVFVRDSSGSWSQQGNKLVGTGAVGAAGQGVAVAISADGNTIAIGAHRDNNYIGATWIFTRENGNWLQQGNKLVGTGTSGQPQQGTVLKLSSNGNSLLVGAPTDGEDGAWWFFNRVSNNWVQTGDKSPIIDYPKAYSYPITPTGIFSVNEGEQTLMFMYPDSQTPTQTKVTVLSGVNRASLLQAGEKASGIAISADGSTAMVGDNTDSSGAGSVRFFIEGPVPITRDSITFAQPDTLTYGMADVALNISATNNTQPITLSSSTPTIATIVNNKLHIRTAGTVRITASQSGFIPFVNPVTRTIVIKKAPLTIKADDKSIAATEPIPALTATYTGFVNSETIAMLDTVAKLSTVATPSSPAGTYPITVSGASAKNYDFIYQNGSLTITSATSGSPAISSLNTTSGVVGSLVTVTGSNLLNPTAFTIGGKPLLLISNSNTSAVGLIMPGAVTGSVSLTTANGTTVAPGTLSIIASNNPYKQQGNKIAGQGAEGNDPRQGFSVAISADGNTAVVGAVFDNNSTGATYVFVRTDSIWTQQGAKLIGTGGLVNQQQGAAVGISANGNTIVVGGNGNRNATGAAWIFTRAGTVWSQQGEKLIGTGGVGGSQQGSSAAISADGNTVAIGGVADNSGAGAVWVYKRSNGVWTQQGDKLRVTTGGGNLGRYVAFSADGNTLLAGAPGDNGGVGANWVFVRNGNTWTQQGDKLLGTGAVGAGFQGYFGALSADGNVAVTGAPLDNNSNGAIWVFTRDNSGAWSQQGDKLSGSGNTGNASQGNSVSISADGNTIVEGGPTDNSNVGAVWVFKRSNGLWTQLGTKLTGTGHVAAPSQGSSIAISADASTIIEGAPLNNASWIFYAQRPRDEITFNQPGDVTYGAADTALAASSTNTLLPVTFKSSDTTIVSIVNNKIHVKTAGTVNITASQADINIAPVTRSLQVNQAELTITADNKTKQPGADNPVFTATYSGFKNGDDTTAFATQPVFTTTATKNSPLGTYPINVGGASAKKYSFVYVNGTLTVASEVLPNNVNVKLTMSPLAVLTLASSSSSQYDYTASVAAGTDSVTITPVPANPGATVTVEGIAVASGAVSVPIALLSGVTVIHVRVLAANGTTVRDYNISVSKNGSSDASLKSLSLINPRAVVVSVSSDGTTLNKSASVPASASTVSVYAIANDSTATIRVNGTVLNGSTSNPVTLNAGNTPTLINVSVTAKDGTSRLYVITVNKTGSSDASLKSLRITDPVSVLVNGTSSGNVFYKSTSVAATTSVVTLSAEATEAHATIRVNGTLLTGTSMPVTLNSDNNPTNINVLVTAQDGTTATYIVVVSKNGSSNAGLLSWGIFNPTTPITSVSSSGTTFYKAATVANSTPSVVIKALPADPNATIRVNGNLLINGQSEALPLNADSTTTTIRMVVTAQDSTTRTYVIVVSKAPALEGHGINQQQSFASAVNTEVVVHQGVSPNGDGLNDVLVIEGLANNTNNHITIVNVSGALAYETTAYGSNGNVFDGHSNKTGVLQKPGTYYYVLDYNDGKATQRKTGYIVLKY